MTRTDQAVTVAESHLAGVSLVLQVAGVMAAGGIGVAPGHSSAAPVLHAELARQQPRLQREVQQEAAPLGGQLVVQLRVVGAAALISALAGIAAAGAVAVNGATAAMAVVGAVRAWLLRLLVVLQGLPPGTHAHWDGNLILVQAGQELLWGDEKEKKSKGVNNGRLRNCSKQEGLSAGFRHPCQGSPRAGRKLLYSCSDLRVVRE